MARLVAEEAHALLVRALVHHMSGCLIRIIPVSNETFAQRANRKKRTLAAVETPVDPLFCSQARSVTPVYTVAFLPTTQTVTGHLVTWARVRSMTSCDDAKTLGPDIQRNQ